MVFSAMVLEDADLYHLPERAIQSFENVNALAVVVHDLTGKLWPFLSPERFRHCSRFCVAVKATHDWACSDFELTRLRKETGSFPHGRFHVCHAGALEWVMPVHLENQFAWMLFAGQRRPTGAFGSLIRDSRISKISGSILKPPPPVTEVYANHILESLRQLRARLLEWHENMGRLLRGEESAGLPDGNEFAHRRLVIERYIYQNHDKTVSIAGLARELHLSESRTIHLVKQLFGRSYIRLVNERRLRTAASLLRETSMPILQVSLNSGFEDISHFYRFFKRRFGVTPLTYRGMPPT